MITDNAPMVGEEVNRIELDKREGAPVKRSFGTFAGLRFSLVAALAAVDAVWMFIAFPGAIEPSSVWAAVALSLGVLAMYGAHEWTELYSGTKVYGRAFSAINTAFAVMLVYAAYNGFGADSLGLLVERWPIILFLVLVNRFAFRRLALYLIRSPNWRRRAVILGTNSEAIAMAEQIRDRGAATLEVIGLVGDDDQCEAPKWLPTLGKGAEVEKVIADHDVQVVILADTALLRERLENDERAMEYLSDVDLEIGTGMFELLATGLSIREEGFVPLIELNKRRVNGLHWNLKTILDYVIAVAALLLLFPAFAILVALIKLESKGPAIYRRRVVGLGRREFDAFKFRTMHLNGDERLSPEQRRELYEEGKLKNDPRITRIGKFIRKVSLDEFPQLVNVLLGEMSIVGPRMITMPELEKFGKWQHSRMSVKPGMTGLWQVSGRSDLNYADRVRLDLWYVRNHTIWLDLKILGMTVPVILFRRGAY